MPNKYFLTLMFLGLLLSGLITIIIVKEIEKREIEKELDVKIKLRENIYNELTKEMRDSIQLKYNKLLAIQTQMNSVNSNIKYHHGIVKKYNDLDMTLHSHLRLKELYVERKSLINQYKIEKDYNPSHVNINDRIIIRKQLDSLNELKHGVALHYF
jgi:hypothetical protein